MNFRSISQIMEYTENYRTNVGMIGVWPALCVNNLSHSRDVDATAEFFEDLNYLKSDFLLHECYRNYKMTVFNDAAGCKVQWPSAANQNSSFVDLMTGKGNPGSLHFAPAL